MIYKMSRIVHNETPGYRIQDWENIGYGKQETG